MLLKALLRMVEGEMPILMVIELAEKQEPLKKRLMGVMLVEVIFFPLWELPLLMILKLFYILRWTILKTVFNMEEQL